jgi:hypothetical protein
MVSFDMWNRSLLLIAQLVPLDLQVQICREYCKLELH